MDLDSQELEATKNLECNKKKYTYKTSKEIKGKKEKEDGYFVYKSE